ncbi:Demethylmenaquinone methyltransferase (fragment) [Capnocytophaga canimorsus]
MFIFAQITSVFYDQNNITPYKDSDKGKTQVRQMFNNISGNYDGLNRVISLGSDIRWRKDSG